MRFTGYVTETVTFIYEVEAEDEHMAWIKVSEGHPSAEVIDRSVGNVKVRVEMVDSTPEAAKP